MNTMQTLECSQSSNSGRFIIKYYHCGKVGKNRAITIKHRQNNVLKTFRFADAKTPAGVLALKVKTIRDFKKDSAQLKFFYSSGEQPNGRQLATLIF